MKPLLKEEKAQALVELAIVFIIFYFFVIGIVQLTLLGHGYIKIQQIARRAAWHGSLTNNRFDGNWRNERYNINQQLATLGSNTSEIRPKKISGNLNDGFVYELSYNVPAVGYFNLFWKKGYKTIKTKTAVISSSLKSGQSHPLADKTALQNNGNLSLIIKKVSEYSKENLGL